MNSQQLLQMYQAGRNEAATVIFDRYVARLTALAHSRIGSKLRRRVDAEDIVQSAYRSFFVHAQQDEYQVNQAGDLWRLLAGITLHKLYGQIEKHTAARRSIDHEAPTDLPLTAATLPEASPEEAVAIVEELRLVFRDLQPEERLVLTASLQGQENSEISRTIEKSERTVRRLLASARRKVEQRLLHSDATAVKSSTSEVEHDAPLLYADYVLEQLLGSGGMGKVFRARVKETQQQVAIKALNKARQSDPRAVTQFAKEAQVLTRLRHANIVRVEGLGRFPNGGYFMVLDYVDGVNLQSQLEAGPFPIPVALGIVHKVADAIGHAHDQGIIHCDLKPGNILQNQNGTILVTDFGFAFLIAGGAATTGNCLGGTVGYIAPEIMNRRSLPAPTTDIYSLGVLLWTLITGTLPEIPFTCGDTQKELAPVARIVRRCLAEDPGKRYQTTTELQRELRAF
ncbi:protein kinase domain-containing protein [Gimesia panareensis]|uniref:protein kinase domain-containing protein n=1 Tax=Gimesia panareensis TaxID=2527978 RepID=UPI0011898511|nr:protein kinase [Gimesia panareensis]QDU49458.1 Serine/threonine-protein kinase PrkC [Gimesia panareensis]